MGWIVAAIACSKGQSRIRRETDAALWGSRSRSANVHKVVMMSVPLPFPALPLVQ